MGVNLRLIRADGATEHETDLCTNGGYSALCGWLEALSEDKYPAAAALARDGTFIGTDTLTVELEQAIAGDDAPVDPDVAHVADRLLDLLGVGRPGETVVIEP